MAEKKEDKLIQILKDLNSNDSKLVLESLNKIKTEGDKRAIVPMIELLSKSESIQIKKEIIEILSQLKLESAQDELIDQIILNKYPEFRPTLLSTIWNSPQNPKKHLSKFVKLATLGDIETTIECFTIIENLEPPMREEWLMDAQIEINKYLVAGKENKVDALFKSIVNKIREWENLEN